MKVDFNVTEVDSYATQELNRRKLDIASIQATSEGPMSTRYWATNRKLWARVISSADINNDSRYRTSTVLGLNQVYLPFELLYDTGVNTAFPTDSPTNRPIFGLDNIKIAYKGPMGSSRSCTFNFKCWTLEHLEVLEKLYMVPGISIVLEWGWSITSDGSPVFPDERLVELGPMKDPYGTVMGYIISNREKYSGNYDGMIGVITNFSWTLNEDLGFDCTVELISPGEMWLEQNATNSSKQCSDSPNDQEQGPIIHSNLEYIFHYIHKNCKGIAGTDGEAKRELLKNYNNRPVDSPIIFNQRWIIGTSEYDKNRMDYWESTKQRASELYEAAKVFTGIGIQTQADTVYITWAYFVALLNSNLNRYSYSELVGNSTMANREAVVDDICLGLDLIPITMPPKCFSADPRICSVGYPSGIWPGGENYPESDNSYTLDNLDFAYNQIKKFGNKNDIANLNDNETFKLETGVGLLNNVLLNCEYLRDTIISFTGERLNVQDFLTKVLSDINICFGDLWNLQVVPGDDKNPHMLHIADVNYTSTKARLNTIKAYEFNLSTTADDVPAHIIRSMTLESKLAAGMSTMLLYGQNMNDNGNNDNAHLGMKLYTENIVDGFKENNPQTHLFSCEDPLNGSATEVQWIKNENGRFIPVEKDEYGNFINKDDPNDLMSLQSKEAALLEKDPLAAVDRALQSLLNTPITEDNVSQAKSALQKLTAYINTAPDDEVSKVKNSLPRNSNILLPISFGITLDGFGGFKWGNVISVDYLPERYRKNVYFQITKINHDITVDDWTTTVETMMRLKNKDSNITGGTLKSTVGELRDKIIQKQLNKEMKVQGLRDETGYASRAAENSVNLGMNLPQYYGIESAKGDLSKAFSNVTPQGQAPINQQIEAAKQKAAQMPAPSQQDNSNRYTIIPGDTPGNPGKTKIIDNQTGKEIQSSTAPANSNNQSNIDFGVNPGDFLRPGAEPPRY